LLASRPDCRQLPMLSAAVRHYQRLRGEESADVGYTLNPSLGHRRGTDLAVQNLQVKSCS
jgi:hypothetical protein